MDMKARAMWTATPPPLPRAPVLAIVVVALSALPYAMMLAGIGGLHDVDGMSRGLAGLYTLVAAAILWILLAVLLVNAAVAGEMPLWAGIAALVLHPASLVATVLAIDLLGSDRDHRWAIIVPISVPPLLAGYAFWARLPRLHAVLAPHPTGGVVWGAVLMLSLATVPGMIEREKTVEENRKAIPFISDEEQREQRRQERLARFEQLTPTSPLDEYLQFLGQGDELRDRAVNSVRLVENRQAQAEAMLRDKYGLDIVRNLSVLELRATPEFCMAANDYLRKRAEDARPKGTGPTFWVVEDELEILMPAFDWLVAQHCEVSEALAEMEETVRAYPEPSYSANPILVGGRETYLAALARLRRAGSR
jgi:hypothetical protein